ncbi:MAG TPA: hypothetical protein VHE36_11430, partial [Sphingomicrobium sp.]|nr:hypothetical protein [Sphingomicrobium sp.]
MNFSLFTRSAQLAIGVGTPGAAGGASEGAPAPLSRNGTAPRRAPRPSPRAANEIRARTSCSQGASQRVLIVSGYHDYRTAKRASIHQIADGLVRKGFDVAFVSTRFSLLSKLTSDSRLFLWDKANRIEQKDGVECLLWRTLVHPFSSRLGFLERMTGRAYDFYAELGNPLFDGLVRKADYVIVESGTAAIYIRRIRRTNPSAKIIYYAADRLETINAHPFVRKRLVEDDALIDHFSLRSEQLSDDFPNGAGRMFKAGFGINSGDFSKVGPSPYAKGKKVAVSVGSMLFDASVFQLAAANFPELEFHVIGCGSRFEAPPNVHIHDEMPFESTLAYVKHAKIGIAAYSPVAGAEYLADSSLKLAQFDYCGLPSVCPDFAVGSSCSRIGYEPGNEAS